MVFPHKSLIFSSGKFIASAAAPNTSVDRRNYVYISLNPPLAPSRRENPDERRGGIGEEENGKSAFMPTVAVTLDN